ncbi:MAG: ribosome-associated translation inhibitor RaiA [Candidatus Brocadiaceae bacterium]
MDVEIAGRHVDVTDEMEAHIWERIERLPRYDDKIQYITVTLDMDAGTQLVEIIAKCHRADLVAEARARDMYQCIDEAFSKIQRQIIRHHDKLVSHNKKAGE